MKFGYIPDLADKRDLRFRATTAALPVSVDLRFGDTAIYDQGTLGSCTANAIAAHLDFNRKKQGEAAITPSRLFIYYNERVYNGTVASDGGATIRQSIKEVVKQGACPESEWPYQIAKYKTKPTSTCYSEAVKYEALKYLRVSHTKTAIKQCLADGFPLVFGFTVYDNFVGIGSDGIVPAPKGVVAGGHAVMAIGYDAKYLTCRNSWGKSWGDQGYFHMPWSYVLSKLCGDFWTLRQVD